MSVFFGDSFIGIFNLVKDAKVYKFKGGTAKGLGKENNFNTKQIRKIISVNKNKKCYVFLFGMVDLHFSYYYKIAYDKDFNPKNLDGFIDSIVPGYLKFIQSLPVENKIILCPYYNPVNDSIVIGQLEKYGIIKESDLTPELRNKIKKFSRRRWRTKLVDKFNTALKDGNNIGLKILDANPYISTSKGHIKKIYKDISKYNIHLIWETSILPYTILLNHCGVIKEKINLSTLEKYLKEKKEMMKRNRLV